MYVWYKYSYTINPVDIIKPGRNMRIKVIHNKIISTHFIGLSYFILQSLYRQPADMALLELLCSTKLPIITCEIVLSDFMEFYIDYCIFYCFHWSPSTFTIHTISLLEGLHVNMDIQVYAKLNNLIKLYLLYIWNLSMIVRIDL